MESWLDERWKLAKGKYDPKPADEGACPDDGCIQPAEDGDGYYIISNKTGKPWGPADNPNTYSSKAKAQRVLDAYHATKGFG